MLTQAMVDASALKDAALKKAQAKVLEEAKPKIEEALKVLLEQDEEEFDALLGGDAGGGADMGPGETGNIAGAISMGISDGENMCPCAEEEEEIEIDFGELERQMAADEGTGDMGTMGGQEDLAQDLNLTPPEPEAAGLGVGDEEDEELEEDSFLTEGDLLEFLSENMAGGVDPSSAPLGHPEQPCHAAHPEMTHAEWTHKGDLHDDDDLDALAEGFLSNMFGGKKKSGINGMKGDMMSSMKGVIAQAEEIKARLAQTGNTSLDQKIAEREAGYLADPNSNEYIVKYSLVLSDALELIDAGGVAQEAKMTPDMAAAASKDAHRDYMRDQGSTQPQAPAPKHKSMGQEFDFDGGDDEPLELAEGQIIITKEKLMEIVRLHTKDLFTSQAEMREQNSKLKTLLRKLSENLKDTNLQNARLLYTNQILESVSLNERQKTKIVESVSKAGSVEEAKVIYDTLLTSAGSSKKQKKPKSLREAVERPSTPLFPRRSKPEKVSNPQADRMQKLAGIRK